METGIYTIKNKTTGKMYIGSTTVGIIKRLAHHYAMLNSNIHKNQYLQNAWNKYGEDDFEMEVLEYCDIEFCLSTEQYWMNMFNVTNKDLGYNINPLASGTPNMSKETIEKRRQTMIDNFKDETFKNKYKGRTPWNKGIKLSDEHVEKLKNANRVFTEKGKLKKRNSLRNKCKEIEVYTLEGELLATFRSAIDLQEWSLTSENNLPIKGRFSKGRKGKPANYIQAYHVNRVCKGIIESYKGLLFKFK